MIKVSPKLSLSKSYFAFFVFISFIFFCQKLSAVELNITLQNLVANKKIKNLSEIKISTRVLKAQILYEVQVEEQTYFFVNNKLCAYSVLSNELPAKYKGFKSIIGVDFLYFKQWNPIVSLSCRRDVFVADLNDFCVIFNQKYIEYFVYPKYKNSDFPEISKIIPYCYLLKKQRYFDNIIDHIEERALKQKPDENILKNQFGLSDFYSLISCIIDNEKSGAFGTIRSKKRLKNIVVPVSNSLAFSVIDYSGTINDLISTLEAYKEKSNNSKEIFILTPLSSYIFNGLSESPALNNENSGEVKNEDKLLENKFGFFKYKEFKIIIAGRELGHELSHLISDKRYFNKRKKYYHDLYLAPNWTNFPSFYSINILKDNHNSIFCIVSMRYKNKDIHALYKMIDKNWQLRWFSQSVREYLDEVHWGDL